MAGSWYDAGVRLSKEANTNEVPPTVTVLGGAPFAAGETQIGVDDGALAALAKAWP